MLTLLILLLIPCVMSDEAPPAHMIFAKRLMQSLPELPAMIQGGMDGNNDGIKNMISNMLGGGLIGELVVNPIGIAENVLPDLGLNKTEVMENLNAMSGGMASNLRSNSSSSSLSSAERRIFGKGDLFSLLTTTVPTTTTPQMLVDGKVVDFDNFVRSNHLENRFTTKKPPPTTTPPPTPEEIAEKLYQRLSSKLQNQGSLPQHQDDLSSTINKGMVDPNRATEVNRLLRRAPPKNIDTLSQFDAFGNEPGFVQTTQTAPAPLDPEINEVVTNLRIKGADGMSVEDVRRLKNLLRTYEESLQTKEFIAKRNQLQVLQNELEEHRKRIDLQRRMEEELRKKEKELEHKRLKMESQLREQLSSWNLTFDGQPPPGMNPMDLPDLNPVAYPTLVQPEQMSRPETTSFLKQKSNAEDESIETLGALPPSTPPTPSPKSQSRPRPRPTIAAPFSSFSTRSIRLSPRRGPATPAGRDTVPVSSTIVKDEDEYDSPCKCTPISLDRMKGSWVVALASKTLLGTMYEKLSELLQTDATTSLTCSRIEVSAARQSVAAQEGKINWQFRTQGSDRLQKLTGSVLSIDHKVLQVQIKDFGGDIFGGPLCMLRASPGSSPYEYMIVTNADGPCNEAAILVRNPEQFFSKGNRELVEYLKAKISREELETLDLVSFANDCQ